VNSTTLTHPVTLLQAAVPIRVCFLVPHDAPPAMLTAIFKECYERWGGRDSLIVPVRDDVISDAYWNWVRAVDPDVVYSYVTVGDALLRRIDRTWMPSIFKVHVVRDDHTNYVPRYGVDGLKTLSVLPAFANQDRIGPQRRPALLSRYLKWTPDTLVADSFGVNPFGPGTMQVVAVRKHADLYAVGERDPQYHGEAAEREFGSATEVLKMMTERAWEQLTMVQLSGSGYEGLAHFCESAWIGSFSVVVGDTSTDRIAFWNGRIGFADYFRRNIIAVHISEEEARDPELLGALERFIRSASPWESNGVRRVTVRSSSTSDDLLQSVVAALRPYLHPTTERFSNANACAPKDIMQPVFVRQRALERYTDGFVALQPAIPAHLTGPHPPSSFLAGGAWSVEMMVYREGDHNAYGANRQILIPRRWQAVRQITEGAIAKTSVSGGIKLIASEAGKSLTLRFSDDDVTYVTRLFSRPEYLWRDDPRTRLEHASIYPRISEAGRRLLGFLNRLGDIKDAHRVLEDEFWKTVLAQMAVPRASSDPAKRAVLLNRLDKNLKRRRITSIETRDHLEALAEIVAAVAPTLPSLGTSREYAWFVSEFEKTIEALRLRDTSSDESARKRAVAARVNDEVQSRCEEGILIQGYAWSCRRCLHANWATVDAVKKIMSCEVCGWDTSIAADFQWTFRLDEYIAHGIYMGGLRGLVWALGALASFPRYAFQFSPPLDIFDGAEHITDADVACVRDGLFIVGEVKESDRDVNDALGNTLVEVGRKVMPDVILIACMDDAGFGKVKVQVERVRTALDDPLVGVLGCTPSNEYGNPGGIFPRIVAAPYIPPQPLMDDWRI
jgi:hypothetical protein